jgi:endonuclease YncB( thermonuclease family)
VRAVDTDRFGRTVADLYTDNGLVQLQQTRAGWVWANGKYKSDCSQWNAVSRSECLWQRGGREGGEGSTAGDLGGESNPALGVEEKK